MNEQAMKIQAVIETLQSLHIQATFDNINHMMGIFSTLVSVRDELNKPKEIMVDLQEVKPEAKAAKENTKSEE